MAMVTLCPQCQTAFAIQAEHYSAADAWVRCGRCAHVFEVDQHLFELDGDTSTPNVKERSVVTNLAAKQPSVAVNALATHHPGIWLMACLLAWLGLQALVYSRDQLAAAMPELMPVLTKLCQPLACDVRLPLALDKVSMESGSFKRVDANLYAFEGVIKNASDFPVLMPSLELTLIDSDESVVIRKILMPPELGLADRLRANRTQGFEIKFTVDADFSSRIAGYRSLLFYP